MHKIKKFEKSIVTFIFGTVLSIVVGLLLANEFNSPYQYIIGLLSEILVILLSFWILVCETYANIIETINEHDIFTSACNYAANSNDPGFFEKYQMIKNQLQELAKGHYELYDLAAVYNDDIESIKVLKKGEKLYSMCPVGGSDGEVMFQFQNQSFRSSMDQHYSAASRGVVIQRIYIFEKKKLFDEVKDCQEHLFDALNNGIDVRVIFLDDPKYVDANKLPRDFIIFGNNKVSIGKIGSNSRVDGADIWATQSYINNYRQQYEKLLRQSEKFKKDQV